jgi:hypothetical protein
MPGFFDDVPAVDQAEPPALSHSVGCDIGFDDGSFKPANEE